MTTDPESRITSHESRDSNPFTAFVSDLHLAPERPDANRAFFGFLRTTALQADALYVLGDLFEYWAGDDEVEEPFHAEVISALRALRNAGVPLYFMHGNRDFLVSSRFAAATRAKLLGDTHVVELYGTPTLLMHGDLLCTGDVRYQRFRKVVRNGAVQWLFMRLPLAQRRRLIGGARRMSEGEKQAKTMDIMDVAPAAVEGALREHRCTRLIHGHTHRPGRHEHVVDARRCERWVLSDWYGRAQYLRVGPDGCAAVQLG
jgi:UDP-2,3-diacylglucosamine hydrolase